MIWALSDCPIKVEADMNREGLTRRTFLNQKLRACNQGSPPPEPQTLQKGRGSNALCRNSSPIGYHRVAYFEYLNIRTPMESNEALFQQPNLSCIRVLNRDTPGVEATAGLLAKPA